MVCVPCIVIPIFLYIWHRFLQPIVMKFWKLWGPEPVKAPSDPSGTPKESKCPFSKTEVPSSNLPSHQDEAVKLKKDS